ncbi:MAG: hypothetical protein NTV68_01275 [Methanomicrobiales archaeon]|nr:hypothetical protein [Methanomicrobiales archaeon]
MADYAWPSRVYERNRFIGRTTPGFDHPRVLAFAPSPDTGPLHQECVHRLKLIRFAQPAYREREVTIERLCAKAPGAPLLQLVVGRCVRAA